LKGWNIHLEGLTGYDQDIITSTTKTEGPLKEKSTNAIDEGKSQKTDIKSTIRKRYESLLGV